MILILKVHLGCWNSTQSILAWLQAEGKGDKEEDFMYLWHHFLTRWNSERIKKRKTEKHAHKTRSESSLKAAAQSLEQTSPQMTIWSNTLTHPDHIHYMDKWGKLPKI